MNYSTKQLSALVLLRFAIGWHFAYEGIHKILNPAWDATMYLRDAQGWLSEMFVSMSENASLMSFVNVANEWGLFLVGLGLITGTFARIASWGGIVMLLMYYLSHPPFIGAHFIMPMEGSYMWVDKNMVEIFALLVLIMFPTSQIVGFDRYLKRFIPKVI